MNVILIVVSTLILMGIIGYVIYKLYMKKIIGQLTSSTDRFTCDDVLSNIVQFTDVSKVPIQPKYSGYVKVLQTITDTLIKGTNAALYLSINNLEKRGGTWNIDDSNPHFQMIDLIKILTGTKFDYIKIDIKSLVIKSSNNDTIYNIESDDYNYELGAIHASLLNVDTDSTHDYDQIHVKVNPMKITIKNIEITGHYNNDDYVPQLLVKYADDFDMFVDFCTQKFNPTLSLVFNKCIQSNIAMTTGSDVIWRNRNPTMHQSRFKIEKATGNDNVKNFINVFGNKTQNRFSTDNMDYIFEFMVSKYIRDAIQQVTLTSECNELQTIKSMYF